ncbi:hypothetical protein [Sediminicola luteus]|uniref:Uncharacterized protein n=1 Tax=Sediminicola luteus TaxID=319238 RepID=A0A2A4GA57_9FLAO|nr:hypothetical protein [Sediminicola luteus]PCE64860.1 hypothetical protein B7P33_06745 [Sediminicola luteus]
MELHPINESALKNIDFLNRYKKLSNTYRDEDNCFDRYDNNKVIEVIESFGYETKYFKSEDFFMIKQQIQDYEFQFNLKFKYGACEFIWGVIRNSERLPLGGPWGAIIDLLDKTHRPLPLPLFSSYDTLKDILVEAFDLYEGFKDELLV